MKTVERIKRDVEIIMPSIKNHTKTVHDAKNLKPFINAMHIACNRNKLSEAYHDYIYACINLNYTTEEIIAGIMQNDTQNKKFNVDIDSVIESLLKIKNFTINLSPANNNSFVETTAEPKTEAKEELPVYTLYDLANNNSFVEATTEPKTEAKEEKKAEPKTEAKEEKKAEPKTEATAAQHTTEGFNINSFIKNQSPTINNNKEVVFPHQICGLSDSQIIEFCEKHFKVLEELPAYALYDLANNKLLGKKMKELNSKQRPNNPFLTQVDMHDYVNDNKLLTKYNTAFTIPCKNKNEVIVVLFNTTPVMYNGMLQYPLKIFTIKK